MNITVMEQKRKARKFSEFWGSQNLGYEKQDTAKFWVDLLQSVFGVQDPIRAVDFEKKVTIKKQNLFIDAYIPDTKVLIEQKGKQVDLLKPKKQSDNNIYTPFEQAKRYADALPYSEKPRYIVCCNFKEFLVYDQEEVNKDPYLIKLNDLEFEYHRLNFLLSVNQNHLNKQENISVNAGIIIKNIYEAIQKQYKNGDKDIQYKSLNILCVRLVFCLYAEDSGLFLSNQFGDYLENKEAKDLRVAIIRLFNVLNTPYNERDPYLEDDLKAFPYVNGGLFNGNDIEIPNFTDEIKDILIKESSSNFNWSMISPTIFGSIFESTLNPETRRGSGMHYTSINNIHKLIDPLFLDALKNEFEEIKQKISFSKEKMSKNRNNRYFLYKQDRLLLENFQNKLASLKFLDPACGSANFLTETYMCLRHLENRVLLILNGNMNDLFVESMLTRIKVNINQFYGIEINDFAVAVAKTALWIAESQMLEETNTILSSNIDFLPLKSYVNILEGNALNIDWNNVIKKEELNYIIGNPPFVGRRYRTEEQKREVKRFFDYKDVDYVACWHKKASLYIQGTNIECAFVSTSSITQGEQVKPIWDDLFNKFNININFAYKEFNWSNEAINQAQVSCVIIGFSTLNKNKKKLFLNDNSVIECNFINAYLNNEHNLFIENRTTPLCENTPIMKNGNVPLDGDYLKIESTDIDDFKDCKFIKELIGGSEVMQNKKRYVLWLKNALPQDLLHKKIKERICKCKEFRLSAKDKQTIKLAECPHIFRDTNEYDNYIAIPLIVSPSYLYLPMAFYDYRTIPTNQVQVIPNGDLYHFGILSSKLHILWTKNTSGKLGNGTRYSKGIVYNNFIWPNISKEQKKAIEESALRILKARDMYKDTKLKDLYNEISMPKELREAHKINDKEVLKAYNLPLDSSDKVIINTLFELYNKKIKEIS